MIDLTDKQNIFNEIQAASGDNRKMFNIAQDVFHQVKKLRDGRAQQEKDQAKRSKGLEALNSLSVDSTEAELRACTKLVLIEKLRDQSITAAEFAQFKDVFNLASDVDQLSIETVSFADVVSECPRCGADVYRPEIGE